MKAGEKYRVKEKAELIDGEPIHCYDAGDVVTVEDALIPSLLYYTTRDSDGLRQIMLPKQLEKLEA